MTIFINSEMMGDNATDADAAKMVELLCARGYDAHTGNNSNDLDDESRERFDADFAVCLEQIA